MAKDKAAKERARAQKKKAARVRDQKRREGSKRLARTMFSVAVHGDPEGLARWCSMSPAGEVIKVPPFYDDVRTRLKELKLIVDRITASMGRMLLNSPGEEEDLASLCLTFNVTSVHKASRTEFETDVLPTPRLLVAAAADPMAVARSDSAALGGGELYGIVACLLTDISQPVWIVCCSDQEGQLAAWTVRGDTWFPAINAKFLLALLQPAPDRPVQEAEAIDELLHALGSTPSEDVIDTDSVAAQRALAIVRDTQLWWFERFRRLCIMEDGTNRELNTLLASRDEERVANASAQRDLQSQVTELRRLVPVTPATAVPTSLAQPAPPTLGARMAMLFQPA